MSMKKRWIALYVENEVGVLAKVSGLFAGKSYNLHSLTVGTTEDETMSRMTIGVKSDDITFEQIKKQLNRMVEVIKVMDLTDTSTHMKEILYIKILNINAEDIDAAFEEAKKHTDAPTIIEFMVSTDELVLPMVKGGNPMSEMILK